jgi:propanol-preferring alcohol dehydrogenase
MAETMRAYRMVKPGMMPQIIAVPIPQPGPGQIRLRTAGAGLCHSDLLIIHADPPIFPIPSTIGHEATGWIDEVGAGVEGFPRARLTGCISPGAAGGACPACPGAKMYATIPPTLPALQWAAMAAWPITCLLTACATSYRWENLIRFPPRL